MAATRCTRCQEPLDVLDVVNGRTVCARCRESSDCPPPSSLRGFLSWKRDRPAPPPEPPPAAQPEPEAAPSRRRRRVPPRAVRVAANALVLALVVALHVWLYHTLTSAARPVETRPARPPAQAAYEDALAYRALHPRDVEGAIRRFEAVRGEHPDTPYAERAALEIERLRNPTK